MKNLVVALVILFCQQVYGQQGNSIYSIIPNDTTSFGIYGVGSLNTEAFENVNGSGKLSGYVMLDSSAKRRVTVFLSYNRNATNSDSTLASTILFPDIGKASFIGTVNCMWNTNRHNYGFYLQGAFKSIKGEQTIKGLDRDTTLTFSVLDWQAGVRYVNKVFERGGDRVLFGASLFINNYNIPNEDYDDYNYIYEGPATGKNMPSHFWAWGSKISLEINKIQLFADFRHVIGKPEIVPNRDLRGFNVNVGVVFNADFYSK